MSDNLNIDFSKVRIDYSREEYESLVKKREWKSIFLKRRECCFDYLQNFVHKKGSDYENIFNVIRSVSQYFVCNMRFIDISSDGYIKVEYETDYNETCEVVFNGEEVVIFPFVSF